MKTYILILSKKFPVWHSRAGNIQTFIGTGADIYSFATDLSLKVLDNGRRMISVRK